MRRLSESNGQSETQEAPSGEEGVLAVLRGGNHGCPGSTLHTYPNCADLLTCFGMPVSPKDDTAYQATGELELHCTRAGICPSCLDRQGLLPWLQAVHGCMKSAQVRSTQARLLIQVSLSPGLPACLEACPLRTGRGYKPGLSSSARLCARVYPIRTARHFPWHKPQL